jgi:hopanoid biosynthesis associated protein HpnK
MKISFVLPMHNEALNIEAMVEMIRREAAPRLEDYEVVIVNDASTDDCGEIADRMARQDSRIRVVHHPHNRGLGASIRSGLAASRMPYVLYSDSDLPVDFSCLKWVLTEVTPEVNLLIGYRLGRAEGLRRTIMSWVYNRLIRVVFGLRVRDVNFAFKLIRRDLLSRLDLRSEGSFIDAEILLEARRARCRLVEVGLEYHVRQAGVSSLSSPAVVLRILREMLDYLTRDEQPTLREVIVNGDDFGLHSDINSAIGEAHRRGLLTSASLLANGPAFAEAVAVARQHPGLEIGVHLALTQLPPCAPIEQIPRLVARDRRFPDDLMAVTRRLLTGRVPEQQIEAEFRAQIERVRAAGLPISHLDSHQHIHVLPACARIVARLAREYQIPAVRLPREPVSWPVGVGTGRALSRLLQSLALRLACWRAAHIFRRTGLIFPDRFYGFANAGRMESEIGRRLARARPGVTEIGCHPGRSTVELAKTIDWGYHWGEEFHALCRHATRAALDLSGARMASWSRCRSRSVHLSWFHAAGRLAVALPPYLWFGLLALLVSRPVDPMDKYGTALVIAGLIMHLTLVARKAGPAVRARRAAVAVAAITPYVGFVFWSNSLWLAVVAVPLVIWHIWRSLSGSESAPYARSRRFVWLTALLVLLLVPLFEMKEERAERHGARPVFLGAGQVPVTREAADLSLPVRRR